MAGESPGRSGQRKSSGETAGERDPRLAVFRERTPEASKSVAPDAKAEAEAEAGGGPGSGDAGTPARPGSGASARTGPDEVTHESPGADTADTPTAGQDPHEVDRPTGVFRTRPTSTEPESGATEPESRTEAPVGASRGGGAGSGDDAPEGPAEGRERGSGATATDDPTEPEAESPSEPGAGENSAPGTGDSRLRAAVAAWVATADEPDADAGGDPAEDESDADADGDPAEDESDAAASAAIAAAAFSGARAAREQDRSAGSEGKQDNAPKPSGKSAARPAPTATPTTGTDAATATDKPAAPKSAPTGPAPARPAVDEPVEAKSASGGPAPTGSAVDEPAEAKSAPTGPAPARPAVDEPAEAKSASGGSAPTGSAADRPTSGKPTPTERAEAKSTSGGPASTGPAADESASGTSAPGEPAEAKSAPTGSAPTGSAADKLAAVKPVSGKSTATEPAAAKSTTGGPASARPEGDAAAAARSAEAKSAEAKSASGKAAGDRPAPGAGAEAKSVSGGSSAAGSGADESAVVKKPSAGARSGGAASDGAGGKSSGGSGAESGKRPGGRAADAGKTSGGRDGDGDGDGDGDREGIDQATAVFKTMRPTAPKVDQPTAMLKLPATDPKAPRAPKGGPSSRAARPESDTERTSTFVPLKPDDVRSPRPPSRSGVEGAAGAAGAQPRPVGGNPPLPPAAGAGLPEAERTRQQPLPPKPPLDLLAELTNKPAPPETPVRTTVRRVKVWTPVVLLLLVVFAVVQTVRPLPDPKIALTATPSYTFEGGKIDMPWPGDGQSAVEVEGVGSMGTEGAQKPAPIASMAKAMTAYVILKEHPLKGKETGPKVAIDQKGEDDAKKPDESTAKVTKGQEFTLRQMIELLMIPSGNNIARLLGRWDTKSDSEAEFVKKMNAAAKDLGMTNTTYTDPSGFDKGTVSTPLDQIKLGKAVMENDVFRAIVDLPQVEVPGIDGMIYNNNNILLKPGVNGIKTGSTTPAGGNLLFTASTIVDGKERRIIGSVMNQRTGTKLSDKLQAAIDNSLKLIEKAQEAVTSAKVVKKGDVVGYVDDGLGGHTPVVATQDLKAVGWPGLKVDLAVGAAAGKTVPHTAKAGDVVGEITVGTGPGQVKAPVALQSDLVEPGFGTKLQRLG